MAFGGHKRAFLFRHLASSDLLINNSVSNNLYLLIPEVVVEARQEFYGSCQTLLALSHLDDTTQLVPFLQQHVLILFAASTVMSILEDRTESVGSHRSNLGYGKVCFIHFFNLEPAN